MLDEKCIVIKRV